jgi:ABC-type antimicrobial peptide transport system permease subunit
MGSTRAQIVRLVVNGGLETVTAGLLIGGVGAFFAIRLLRSMLFGVAPSDPVSFVAAAIVLVMTVLIAGLAPAGRAASIQPMEALRTE